MSEVDDADELAALATTLKRHLERRRRAGIRVSPKADSPQAKTAGIKNGGGLGATVADLIAGTTAGAQVASAVNFVRQEPISYSVSAIRTPS
jgi:hypothetical protein